MGKVGSTGDLKLQIDKGELNVFVLRCDAFDVEAHCAEACREHGDHAPAIFNLNPQAHGVGALYLVVPIQGDQPIRLFPEFNQVSAAVPVNHQALFLAQIALNWIAR